MKKFKTAKDLLGYLNSTYISLHEKYEGFFWLSHMGDHSYDKKMNDAQVKRDAFRADPVLKELVDFYIKKEKGEIKRRLNLWKHFFSLYQTPPEALLIKKRIGDLESQILKIRTNRKEGYIDPYTNKFIEAPENKMRMIISTNSDEKVRKACFDSMEELPYDTLDLYVEIVKARNDFAHALGYKDFYEYKARIDEDMTKKELFSIFEKVYEKTKFAFKNLRKIEENKPGLRKPWNFSYMMTGDFTKEADPFFLFENALIYWGRSFAALGVDFKGGTLTLDLLERKGKYNNGFCHYPKLVRYKNGKFIPGASNFTSNAIPGQIGSGAHNVNTLFHEAGHAADRLNSRQEDACINTEYPPSTVSWAETHSMFMDSISDSIEWKIRYAKNSSGQSYPFDLFKRKLKEIHPVLPLGLMHIMYVVFFEKEIYECKNLTPDFVISTARKMHRKYFDQDGDSLRILNVPHIYSWESSAYYHGYGLAELGVYQWRDYFYKKYGYIVDNPNVGKEMMKIWSYASRYSAKKFIKMATRKFLKSESFIKSVTKSYDQILKDAEQRVKFLEKIPFYTKPIDLNAKIRIVHGKEKIADNSKGFEDMDRNWRKWLKVI